MEMLTLTTYVSAVEVFLGTKFSAPKIRFRPPLKSLVVVYVDGLPSLGVPTYSGRIEMEVSTYPL
jgi:hypothetical protein